MKKLKQLTAVFAAALMVLLSSCAAEKEEPLYYEDGIVNLNGPWGEDPATDLTHKASGFSADFVATVTNEASDR